MLGGGLDVESKNDQNEGEHVDGEGGEVESTRGDVRPT